MWSKAQIPSQFIHFLPNPHMLSIGYSRNGLKKILIKISNENKISSTLINDLLDLVFRQSLSYKV